MGIKISEGASSLEDRIYWLGWQLLMPGAGNRLWSLVKHFGSPRAAWEAGSKELAGAPGLGAEGAGVLARRRDRIDPAGEAARLNSRGITFACHTDPYYPENLLQIYDPPPVVFLRGQIKMADSLSIAIVGSRRPSP